MAKLSAVSLVGSTLSDKYAIEALIGGRPFLPSAFEIVGGTYGSVGHATISTSVKQMMKCGRLGEAQFHRAIPKTRLPLAIRLYGYHLALAGIIL